MDQPFTSTFPPAEWRRRLHRSGARTLDLRLCSVNKSELAVNSGSDHARLHHICWYQELTATNTASSLVKPILRYLSGDSGLPIHTDIFAMQVRDMHVSRSSDCY